MFNDPFDVTQELRLSFDEHGLNAVGFTIYSLPPTVPERIEYLQMIADEIVAPVVAANDRP